MQTLELEETVYKEVKAPEEIIIDLTSFLRFDLYGFLGLLRILYPHAKASAYVNPTKPLYSKRKKYVHNMCERFGILLFPVPQPMHTIIRKVVQCPQKILLVSNSPAVILKCMESVPPDWIDFAVESIAYQELKPKIKDGFKIIPLKLIPKKLGLLRAFFKLSFKEVRQARGFFLRDHLNKKLLAELPLPLDEVKKQIEQSKIYPPEQIKLAMLGFLLHNPVKINQDNQVVFDDSENFKEAI